MKQSKEAKWTKVNIIKTHTTHTIYFGPGPSSGSLSFTLKLLTINNQTKLSTKS